MRLSRTAGITLARVDLALSMAIVRRLREAPVWGPTEGPCGGTGRRARLKIEFRKECWFDSGQGHQAENTNRNNNLSHWFDSIFLKKFSSFVESADKKLAPAVQFVGIFVGIGKLNDRGEFRYSERRNRADGPQERWRGRQPKQI